LPNRLRVDPLDFQILREIFAGDEAGFRSDRAGLDAIAKRLEVHRNTVSARVRRLTEHAVYLPASLDVEPGVFGLVGAVAFFEIDRALRTPALLDAVFHLEGVQFVMRFTEGWTLIVFAEDETGLLSKLEVLRALTRARSMSLDVVTTRDYPEPEPIKISKTDARLVVALLKDSRAPFSRLARELGVSVMTIKRRYDRLWRSGVIYAYPAGGGGFDGMVTAYFLAKVPTDPRRAARVHRALLEALPNHFIRNLTTRGSVHILIDEPSVDALDERARAAAAIPGVEGATLRIFEGIAPNPLFRDWLARIVLRPRAEAGGPLRNRTGLDAKRA
jgi:DNA-binding Lrp family transcriptional regulator